MKCSLQRSTLATRVVDSLLQHRQRRSQIQKDLGRLQLACDKSQKNRVFRGEVWAAMQHAGGEVDIAAGDGQVQRQSVVARIGAQKVLGRAELLGTCPRTAAWRKRLVQRRIAHIEASAGVKLDELLAGGMKAATNVFIQASLVAKDDSGDLGLAEHDAAQGHRIK